MACVRAWVGGWVGESACVHMPRIGPIAFATARCLRVASVFALSSFEGYGHHRICQDAE